MESKDTVHGAYLELCCIGIGRWFGRGDLEDRVGRGGYR